MGSDRTAQTESRYNPDFNPRSLCGERPWAAGCAGSQGRISIHTPRVRSDHGDQVADTEYDISIHAPRVGSDLVWQHWEEFCGISIHAPRVGSDWISRFTVLPIRISIHAPRVGSDLEDLRETLCRELFQSTLPVWGATASCMFWHRLTYISIHAPRVGSDIWKPWTSLPTPYFNPRSPCGERRRTICLTLRHTRFQSTLPVWGATMGIR